MFLSRYSLSNEYYVPNVGGIPGQVSCLSRLRVLDLSFNKLQGELPATIGKLRSLKTLNLGNNSQLSGPLPREITRCINLEHIVFECTMLGSQSNGNATQCCMFWCFIFLYTVHVGKEEQYTLLKKMFPEAKSIQL